MLSFLVGLTLPVLAGRGGHSFKFKTPIMQKSIVQAPKGTKGVIPDSKQIQEPTEHYDNHILQKNIIKIKAW